MQPPSYSTSNQIVRSKRTDRYEPRFYLTTKHHIVPID